MVLDEPVYEGDGSKPELYASIHAWRALGQLKDARAIEPLIALVERSDDDDWVWEDLPVVLRMIGPAAIPALTQSLTKTAGQFFTALTVVDCFEKMAQMNPGVRDECIAILNAQLEKAADNDPGVNANIISTLTDLKATESLPIIERAFATGRVDEMIMGDWDDVQVEFGLKAPDPNQRRPLPPQMQALRDVFDQLEAQPKPAKQPVERSNQQFRDKLIAQKKARDKVRAKRKQAKKQRKQNSRK
jgi:hypothetical protein